MTGASPAKATQALLMSQPYQTRHTSQTRPNNVAIMAVEIRSPSPASLAIARSQFRTASTPKATIAANRALTRRELPSAREAVDPSCMIDEIESTAPWSRRSDETACCGSASFSCGGPQLTTILHAPRCPLRIFFYPGLRRLEIAAQQALDDLVRIVGAHRGGLVFERRRPSQTCSRAWDGMIEHGRPLFVDWESKSNEARGSIAVR
jgi:hypothetical protein